MPRRDLLELTIDDLTEFTNRGTVKRALKDVESDDVNVEFEEGPGERVVAKWSDGFVCEFHHGKPIHDAACSSGVLGISRHVVRSVLAYQRLHSRSSVEESPTGNEKEDALPTDLSKSNAIEDSPATQPDDAGRNVEKSWDPGEITDEQLVAYFGKSRIQRAKARFDLGTLVELTRGRKPSAMFLDEPCFVRFLVPHDLPYATVDCGESDRAKFVAMAVWAFRHLSPEKRSGIEAVGLAKLPTPTALLDRLESQVSELACTGLANSTSSSLNHWKRLESDLRSGELTWPADLASDLIHQMEMYNRHDALFDPERLVQFIGELVARERAIRSQTDHIPQLFIRGTKFDTARETTSSKYVGLGLEVKAGRKNTMVAVYFQDTNSGLPATIQRTFANEATHDSTTVHQTRLKSYSELLATPVYRGIRLSGLAFSRLLLKSSKRTPAGELILPRSSMAIGVNPQSFQWETVKAPLLAEDFSELIERMKSMPPSYLRPRRLAEGVYVVPVRAFKDVAFDPVRQLLKARVFDSIGDQAWLSLPFESRNQRGFKAFSTALQTLPGQPQFVAGRFRMSHDELVFSPLQIILESDAKRFGLNPYLLQKDEAGVDVNASSAADEHSSDLEDSSRNESEQEFPVVSGFLVEFSDLVSETFLTGLQSNRETVQSSYAKLAETSLSIGFVQISSRIQSLVDELEVVRNSRGRSLLQASRYVCQLAMICRVASQ
jgi:hypothetical protein